MDSQIYQSIKYGTNIIPEEEYIDTLITISDVASEMVVKTLGPFGKTTMLNDGSFTYPTKDGWSVLKTLMFQDPVFNVLYQVLRQISFDMVSKVGDGTTGAFVASNIFLHEVLDFLKERPDVRQADMIAAIKQVGDALINKITTSKFIKMIDTDGDFSDIYKIAHVSSNRNDRIAEIIQKIYQETKNPNIYVSMDPCESIDYEIQIGYKFDCNPIMQKLYRNTDDGTYYENNPCSCLIFDHNVNYQEHAKIIGTASSLKPNETVFIFAPHFDDVISNVLGSTIETFTQQGKVPNIMMIQVPLSNNLARSFLSDMILLTNAQVFDYGKVRAFNAMVHNQTHKEKIEDDLLNVAQYHFETTQDLVSACMGKTRKIVVGRNYVLLKDYESVVNQSVYQNTLKDLEEEYIAAKNKADKSSTNLYKDYMNAHMHYTRLLGKLGAIKVGGSSELEKKYMKDVVDDSVLACRSAFTYGYTRGMNMTILSVLKEMKLADTFYTEKRLHSLSYPVIDIFYNTYWQLSKLVMQNEIDLGIKRPVREPKSKGSIQITGYDIIDRCINEDMVYDIVSRRFYTDDDPMIVNSVKSDTESIKAIISILTTIITSNQFLTINRNYDRTTGMQQRRETAVKNKAEDYAYIASEICDAVVKKLPASILSNIIPK